MSCVPVDRESETDEVCANCGKHGSDTVKLKNCTACRLVKYCGVDCQRAHRKQHKKACKQRVAELKDEQLYGQGHERPEWQFCPICTLPIPLPINNGADGLAMVQTRLEKKDPEAINFLGAEYYYASLGMRKDIRKAVELWSEAAKLGSIEALCHLGVAYYEGEEVQQDKAKGVEFFKRAAMQGHIESRVKLGTIEGKKGNHERAAKHFQISAKMGDERSLENIKRAYMAGFATKEQYGQALKGYQEALEEMKSHDRDEAKKLGSAMKVYDKTASKMIA
ncbi:hypothetical protein THAOC_03444 [Thalassiosira oceanica]|uniref:MYND-type domain-containing protein n=1 Tax=Thalassiosira oceanica TaxID=159749 RepID=K0TKY0_THAOC|nr:hypothetical protein THAOC_03444 [Thalassiosira oceanica]|eukprot:EJK74851.1 hypothetical protein THAOC_03444 [Thalassiosira oceanica]